MRSLLFTLLLGSIALTSAAQSTAEFTNPIFVNENCGRQGNLNDRYVSIYTGFEYHSMTVGDTLKVITTWGDGAIDTFKIAVTMPDNDSMYFSGYHVYTVPGVFYANSVVYDHTYSTTYDTLSYVFDKHCQPIEIISYTHTSGPCLYDSTMHDRLLTKSSFEIKRSGVVIDTLYIYNGYLSKGYDYTPSSTPPYDTFEITPIPVSGFNLVCPTSPVKVIFDTVTTLPLHLEFGYECDTTVGPDMQVAISGVYRAIAQSALYISYQNPHCVASNGDVTLELSPKYSFVSADPTPTSVSGNTITWNVGSINIDDGFNFIAVTIEPDVPLGVGDTAHSYVNISSSVTETNTTNNFAYLIDSVRTAYDPNEKSVTPYEISEPNMVHQYRIDFENLGNDTAFNIIIVDTLSSFLDYNSLELVQYSHNVELHVDDISGVKVMRFKFMDIKLPEPSFNPDVNKGFVVYSAKSKVANYGDVIHNTAYIYFDYNPPIVTNTTHNEYKRPSSVATVTKHSALQVYPNPANDVLYVQLADGNQLASIEIINTLGQRCWFDNNFQQGRTNISLNQWPAGVYTIIVKDEKGQVSKQRFNKL